MSKTDQIIDDQAEEIEQLKNQIKWYEQAANWMFHRVVNEKKMEKQYPGYNKLPFPRFEMVITPTDSGSGQEWYSIEWLYGIVYKHFTDDILFIPMSKTTSSGSDFARMKRGKIEYPRRDGVHVRTEMELFNLKGYVLCNGRIEEMKVCDDKYPSDFMEKALLKMRTR